MGHEEAEPPNSVLVPLPQYCYLLSMKM